MMTLFSANHISYYYKMGFFGKKEKKVLHDISFTLEKGETLGLAGVSGAGKSTLVRLIMGLLPLQEGEFLLEGKNLHSLPEKTVKRKMQMLFQNPLGSLNPKMTIRESMEEPIYIYSLPEEKKEEIPKWLDRLRLRQTLLGRYPDQLSGGEIQRICLARLLLLEPEILILDEPTSMLDVSVQAEIVRELLDIQEETQISYLFISHDLDLLRSSTDRIGILKGGKLIETGETEGIYRHPKDPYTRELLEAFENF